MEVQYIPEMRIFTLSYILPYCLSVFFYLAPSGQHFFMITILEETRYD